MGFAVDLDFVAATVICIAVFHGTAGSLSETAAACAEHLRIVIELPS